LQQFAPGREDLGRDLVRLVEGAQHERVVGQAGGGARRRRGQRALRVVGLVAVRHLRDLLAEVRRVGERGHDLVADQVVDVGGAGRSGKAEPGDLQRRRPLRQHRQQRVVGRAL
jgi:hypothetical protein